MDIFGLQSHVQVNQSQMLFPSKKCYFLVVDPKNPSWLSKNWNEGVR